MYIHSDLEPKQRHLSMHVLYINAYVVYSLAPFLINDWAIVIKGSPVAIKVSLANSKPFAVA